jgi:hypothetical protein
MFLMKKMNLKESKTVEKLQINNILKRKIDDFYYEIKSIILDENHITHYHFYGFVIMGKENLKNHFYNENNLFPIYE